jgi:A/G-specific adenine glycosylase
MMGGHAPGDMVQALMDLGAAICRPKQPRCASCPLRANCLAFRSGDPETFPARRPRAPRPHKFGIAYWTERNGRVWLVRRPPKGLLGGMAALPGGEWDQSPPRANPIATVRHVFTHFSLDLQVEPRPEPIGEGWWHPLDGLAEAGLPTLYRRAAEAALAALRETRAAA